MLILILNLLDYDHSAVITLKYCSVYELWCQVTDPNMKFHTGSRKQILSYEDWIYL